MSDEVLYTVSGAARYLGISESTVRSWVTKGKIKCRIVEGGLRIFREDDLEEVKRTL